MKPVGVGGTEAQRIKPSQVAKLRRTLAQVIRSCHFNDLAGGGRKSMDIMERAKASLERFPEAQRAQFLAQVSIMAMCSAQTRGPLFQALLEELGIARGPGKIIEFFGGSNLTLPMVLGNKKQYVQVSTDPLASALGGLPTDFLPEILGVVKEFTPVLNALIERHGQGIAFKFLARLATGERKAIENAISASFPGLRYVQAEVEEFAKRLAEANTADLTIAFFWANMPFRGMELVTKPGGFLVTIDVEAEAIARVQAAHDEPIMQDLLDVEDSLPRNDLMERFSARLEREPGYKALDLKVEIFQKKA